MIALAERTALQLELRRALGVAGAVLRRATRRGGSFALVDDPLRLDLPPLLDGSASPSAATLRLTGALYLQAELEQSGIVIAAELLVRSRDTLTIHDVLARKLEDYASAMRGAGTTEWLDAQRRAQLHARLFGIGSAAGSSDGLSRNNRAFEQLLASLCVALLRVEAALRWSSSPDRTLDAAVRFAARSLLLNIGAQQYGVSSVTALRLDQQLRASIAILNDPELEGMLNVHGVWAVARALLGQDAPDAGRHAARGAAGQAVLHWLASVLPALADERSQVIVVPRDSSAFAAAARWFVASGLAMPRGTVQ